MSGRSWVSDASSFFCGVGMGGEVGLWREGRKGQERMEAFAAASPSAAGVEEIGGVAMPSPAEIRPLTNPPLLFFLRGASACVF